MRPTRPEPSSNVRPVCAGHSPKPMGGLEAIELGAFVGRFVKLAFPTGKAECKTEHMWVRVLRVPPKQGKKSRNLVGVLDNDPVYVTDYKCGDLVEFQVPEVEDVLPPFEVAEA